MNSGGDRSQTVRIQSTPKCFNNAYNPTSCCLQLSAGNSPFSVLVTNPEKVFRKLGFIRSERSDYQTTNINIAVITAVLQSKFSS